MICEFCLGLATCEVTAPNRFRVPEWHRVCTRHLEEHQKAYPSTVTRPLPSNRPPPDATSFRVKPTQEPQMPTLKEQILEFIRTNPNAKSVEIADGLSTQARVISSMLTQLYRTGMVRRLGERAHGYRYTISGASGSPSKSITPAVTPPKATHPCGDGPTAPVGNPSSLQGREERVVPETHPPGEDAPASSPGVPPRARSKDVPSLGAPQQQRTKDVLHMECSVRMVPPGKVTLRQIEKAVQALVGDAYTDLGDTGLSIVFALGRLAEAR